MDEITMYEMNRPKDPENADTMRRAARDRLCDAVASCAGPDALTITRKPAASWRGGLRGKIIIGIAGAAATAAAVATVVVLPSPASHTASPGAAVTLSSLSYSIDTTTSGTSAATVLDKAAAAIGKQAGTASEPNVDWSDPYFHTVQVITCKGVTTTDNVWQTRSDDGAGEHTGGDCGGSAGGGMYPITAGFADFYLLGNQALTESQVDQLPTAPDKLWPLLEGFDRNSLSSDTANPDSNASTMFQSIWNLITSEPLSPAFRKALLEDAAKIPGVTVEGKYTDSLGRTGTVLHIGIWTMAIDTTTGQVLSMTQDAIPGIPICGGKVRAHEVCQPGGRSTIVYASAQLVSSVPEDVADTIASAKASEPPVSVAPAPTPKL
ncbi:MAG TPA: hypothetical protein VGG75_37430 [Trebonia sp.]|jgi:hypothetical protein